VSDTDSGLLFWIERLNAGISRDSVENSFRAIANQHNEQHGQKTIDSFIDKNDKKRGLILVKESGGDILITTSLFKSFHEQYPNHDLYFCCDPKFQDIVVGNP